MAKPSQQYPFPYFLPNPHLNQMVVLYVLFILILKGYCSSQKNGLARSVLCFKSSVNAYKNNFCRLHLKLLLLGPVPYLLL